MANGTGTKAAATTPASSKAGPPPGIVTGTAGVCLSDTDPAQSLNQSPDDWRTMGGVIVTCTIIVEDGDSGRAVNKDVTLRYSSTGEFYVPGTDQLCNPYQWSAKGKTDSFGRLVVRNCFFRPIGQLDLSAQLNTNPSNPQSAKVAVIGGATVNLNLFSGGNATINIKAVRQSETGSASSTQTGQTGVRQSVIDTRSAEQQQKAGVESNQGTKQQSNNEISGKVTGEVSGEVSTKGEASVPGLAKGEAGTKVVGKVGGEIAGKKSDGTEVTQGQRSTAEASRQDGRTRSGTLESSAGGSYSNTTTRPVTFAKNKLDLTLEVQSPNMPQKI